MISLGIHAYILYHSFHPAVLQALRSIARDAHDMNVQVSICGELAGDPAGAVLLTAMGYDALSMNAANLLRVKSVIRGMTMPWAEELLARVLKLDSPHIIRSELTLALKDAGFGRFIRPTKLIEAS